MSMPMKPQWPKTNVTTSMPAANATEVARAGALGHHADR